MRLSRILLIYTTLCTQGILCTFGQIREPLILDADTDNEVDDLFALVRILKEPQLNILGLYATQWQASHWAVPNSMENSHRLNQVILNELDSSIPALRGGVNRMFDWGDLAQYSAASHNIIHQVEAIVENKKLNIIALGALTNIASAIYIQPEIASKIRLYWLGTSYDFEQSTLNRQDFNCQMDQQALHIVLNSDIEMHLMPINVAVLMDFDFNETQNRLPQNHPISRLLLERWFNHLDGGRQQRILWDLALIQAILHPQWAEKVVIQTSKDNGNRPIHYYKSIMPTEMKEEFFAFMQNTFGY